MRLLALVVLLSGCAAYRAAERRAWEKYGDCAVVCDYVQGYMSTSYKLSPTQCRCYTPQLASFNEGRMITLDNPESVVTCTPDVKTRALSICAHQPWRCPEY